MTDEAIIKALRKLFRLDVSRETIYLKGTKMKNEKKYWQIFRRDGEVALLGTYVDALTITSSVTSENRAKARALIGELAETAKAEWWPSTPKKLIMGGKTAGWTCENLAYTVTKINAKLELKGEHCGELFALTMQFDQALQKFTRVDLAMDLALEKKRPKILRSVMERAPLKTRNKAQLRANDNTGDTLYIGSRESPLMGRIYDKSDKYGEALGKIYRFELEIKKVLAGRTITAMRNSDDLEAFIRATNVTQFHKWNIPLPYEFQMPVELPEAGIAISDDDTKIAWLRRQVRGTVQHLVTQGKADKVAEALQLDMVAML